MTFRSAIMPVARPLAIAGLALGVLAGCGESYDRAEFIDELTEDGTIDETVAGCIADRVEADIGIDRLNSRGDLTDEEEAILTEAAFDCVLAG